MMETPRDGTRGGEFEARYVAFLETIANLRPKLHRYCARMTGSVLDGEDVVQDALFQAYRKLDTFDDSRPIGPWLFRIAHNACIDFLRRRTVRHDAEIAVAPADSTPPIDPPGPAVGRALEHLVLTLPPKERASVLLKDVLDYSLEEIAELVGSTIGGVKAALNRGRAKLAAMPATPARAGSRPRLDAETQHLHRLYIDRFNRGDWDGLRELIAADAHVRVVDCFDGELKDAPYLSNYRRMFGLWQLTLGEVDGVPAIISLKRDADGWRAHAVVRLRIEGGRVVEIVDYAHCPWVLQGTISGYTLES